MFSKLPIHFIVVATVCTSLAWVISVHFLFPVDLLPKDDYIPKVIASTIGHSVGLWVLVFIACLALRATIRRQGMWGYNFKRVVCPHCGTRVRRGTRFRSNKEIMWGGWACHECGMELSQWGRPWKQQNTLAKWAVLRAVEEIDKREHRPPRRDERIQTVNDQTQRGDVS